ncbi:MAG: hypothetical protein HKN23_18030 [Verrucomicrobiales bacterium]|nr:hypothetical protein [Verrucomicrobiales bacterium]
MKFFAKPLHTAATIVGALLIGLLCLDLFVQAKGFTFGSGVGSWVEAENTMAVFFLGLILGVLAGIGIFFAHIVLREKRQNQEQDELALLLDSSADSESDEMEWELPGEFARDESREEGPEALEPWERGADWWKVEDDVES